MSEAALIEQPVTVELVAHTEPLTPYAPAIVKALEYSPRGEDTLASVTAQLRQGRARLLRIVHNDQVIAVAVIEVCIYKDDMAVNIWTMTGEHMDWWLDDFMAFVEEYAYNQGAARVSLGGRVGWSRMLKPLGYGVDAVLMSKQVHI